MVRADVWHDHVRLFGPTLLTAGDVVHLRKRGGDSHRRSAHYRYAVPAAS